MWIPKIVLKDIRSFEALTTIELSKGINLLVGPNNSGKSTIAYSVLPIQGGHSLGSKDVRAGVETGGSIEISVEEVDTNILPKGVSRAVFAIKKDGTAYSGVSHGGAAIALKPITQAEPVNFIYPYLSKRKVSNYREDITEAIVNSISGDLSNLYAKVDRVSNPELPAYKYYVEACKKTLGCTITSLPSSGGKKACYVIDNFTNITIDNMGEGVASILGLLVDLCVAENKLFVIEEPENDIHPKALKGLMDLIIQKSENNQFIITTHSNIVVRYLGSEAATKIFSVCMEYNKKRYPLQE